MSVDVLFDDEPAQPASSPPPRRRSRRRAVLIGALGLAVVAVGASLASIPRGDPAAAAVLAQAGAAVDVAEDEEPVLIAVVNRRGAAEAVQVGSDGQVRPVPVDEPLPLGSVSEMVTAAAVLRLVDAGRLDVDDPASSYVGSALPDQVSLRHLLQHTSGLPGLETESGSVVAWSSQNEAVLQDVLAAVTGQDVPTVLREQVVDPAGMNGTTVEPGEGEESAAVVSTPGDLARLLRALHDGTLLSPAAEALLTENPRDVTQSGELQVGLGVIRFTGYGPLVGSFGVRGDHYLLVMHAPDRGATAIWSAPSSVELRHTLRPIARFLADPA
jgi:CubicO group peptidase (beta-lactamase class C family)